MNPFCSRTCVLPARIFIANAATPGQEERSLSGCDTVAATIFGEPQSPQDGQLTPEVVTFVESLLLRIEALEKQLAEARRTAADSSILPSAERLQAKVPKPSYKPAETLGGRSRQTRQPMEPEVNP